MISDICFRNNLLCGGSQEVYKELIIIKVEKQVYDD